MYTIKTTVKTDNDACSEVTITTDNEQPLTVNGFNFDEVIRVRRQAFTCTDESLEAAAVWVEKYHKTMRKGKTLRDCV